MYSRRLARLAMATFALLVFSRHLSAQRWSEMDYGSLLTSTLEVERDNIAYKSIAIRLDAGEGGISQGNVFVSFDTDTLRYAAGWTGHGLMDWRSVVYDGSHNTHPSLFGERVFVNPVRPGWGNPRDGSFDDPRLRGTDGRAYGPLDRQWGHFNGLYRYGRRVVLSYSIGSTSVLDMPGLESSESGPLISRTLQLGSRDRDMVLQVARMSGCRPQLQQLALTPNTTTRIGLLVPDRQVETIGESEQQDHYSFRGSEHFVCTAAEDLNLTTADFSILATIRTKQDGTIFSKGAPAGQWVPDGKTFFVRGGRLCYDIGWVGAIESKKRVNDNQWHSVAATFEAAEGVLRLYVDGDLQAEGPLRPKQPVRGHVARIGFTAPNFPRPQSAFEGDVRSVKFYQRRLADRELRDPEAVDDNLLQACWMPGHVQDGKLADAGNHGHNAELVRGEGATANLGVAVACVGLTEPKWQTAADGSLQLRVPRGNASLRFTLLFAALDRQQALAPLAAVAARVAVPADLGQFSAGGPAQWPESLETEIAGLGESNGPFAVETLTIPQENPWRSWLRLGGFDFFSDGDRAAVCSWQGDVWVVQGLTAATGKLHWRRIASGLFQPLGLKIVADQIYVLGRDQITLLRDLNGDGEADFYQNFNNDAQVTDHFHEFAMDLQTDQYGDFYYMKAARHALPPVVPQHGTLMQVSRDGKQSQILARGFRAPDGLLVNGDGTFLTSDQEGHWTPMNRINWIRPGGFYGNMMAFNPQQVAVDATDPPVCWIHREVDRSPTAQVWVPRDRWGSLGGALLSLSYGTGKTFRVLYEDVGDVLQGGVVQLPIPELPTGIQRGRFHGKDGQLYVCGLFGWSSDKTLAGGFYRIRHTGQQVATPSGLSVYRGGVLLRFPMPLDQEVAAALSNFVVSRWNYKRTANYGSDDYRVSDGKPGRDRVSVSHVSVSLDRQSLFLHIADMTPCMQMRIEYRLQGAGGDALAGFVDHTVHVLKEMDSIVSSGFANRLDPPVSSSSSAQVGGVRDLKPGLVLRIASSAGVRLEDDLQRSDLPWRDGSVVRSVAMLAKADRPPTLFSELGPFIAQWDGFINSPLPSDVTFRAQAAGGVVVRVNDQIVLRGGVATDHDLTSRQVKLQAGLNALRVTLASLPRGAARLRLHWKRDNDIPELLRPEVLVHDPQQVPDLSGYTKLRMGRELVARYRCARCHAVGESMGEMPEMNIDLPALNGVADRLSVAWLRQWISDPQKMRNDITMPHVLKSSNPQEVADIVAYLDSLRSPTAVVEPASDKQDDSDIIERGLVLYEDLGCLACHHLERPDFDDPYQRTSLRYVGAKYRDGGLIRFLRQPHEFYAARRMPDFRLLPEEASALAAYLRDVSEPIEEQDNLAGDPIRGKQAFSDRGCAACHIVNAGDDLPPPAQRPLFELSDVSRGCLARDDSQRNGAPQFAFDNEQRAALLAMLHVGGESLVPDVPAEAAERLMRQLRCTACHRRDGQRPPLPEILAEEGEQGYPAESLPPLTWTGEKLRTQWLETMLSGKLPYNTRPWKRGRMAAFPAYARALAHGLAAQHAVSLQPDEVTSTSAALASVGKRLTEQEQGFHCLQCHGLPRKPPESPFESRGIDFQHVRNRLRTDFYRRWIGNPIQFDSAVPMPRFSPDGKTTPVKVLLDGDAPQQFDAIWEYLKTVSEAPQE